LGQNKDYKIGTLAKYTTLRNQSKDLLAWNDDNVSGCHGRICLPADCCISELEL